MRMPSESKCLNQDGMFSIRKNSQLTSALKPLVDGQRVLVTGASGWLGKNLIDLLLDLQEAGSVHSILLTSSSDKEISLYGGRKKHISKWDRKEVEEFAPTVFINLAFLTRDKLLSTPVEKYIQVNKELIEIAKWVTTLDSVKFILTTSSGASQKFIDDKDLYTKPYETLKFIEERTLSEVAEQFSKKLLILKVWTMSGKYIKHGDLLVIQSLISSMLESKDFEIKSSHEVWRTYIDAYEMIGIALIGLLEGREGIVNSGGIPISLTNLAEIAKETFNSRSKIIKSKSINDSASYYSSSPPDLNQIANKYEIELMGISDQLRETAKTIVQ